MHFLAGNVDRDRPEAASVVLPAQRQEGTDELVQDVEQFPVLDALFLASVGVLFSSIGAAKPKRLTVAEPACDRVRS